MVLKSKCSPPLPGLLRHWPSLIMEFIISSRNAQLNFSQSAFVELLIFNALFNFRVFLKNVNDISLLFCK